MAIHNDVFKTIDNLTPEFIKFWEDMGNLESPTNYKAGVDAVGDYFASYAEKEGWEVERFKHDIVGNGSYAAGILIHIRPVLFHRHRKRMVHCQITSFFV